MDLKLCYTPAVDLARMVRAREISPVEILQNTLDRLDRVEPSLNAFNLTGQPACSVPCGFTDAGLPVGLQLVVRPLEERLLVPVARAVEQVLGHRPDRYPLDEPRGASAPATGT